MSKIQLPIANFPAQDKALDDPARYVVIPKGRRFGITTGFKNKLIKWALERRFTSALWGDVVNSNIEKYIQRLFIPSLQQIPHEYWKWTKNPHTIHLFDSYIDFRSAERPESWEGFGYDITILNEAGIILKNQYLWDNAVRPMMWDNPKSRVFFGGTPKIGSTVFRELWQRACDPKQPEYAGHKFSSFDNPYLPLDKIRKDMETMQQRAIQQEIYAEFLDDDGVVFRGIEKVAILQPADPAIGHLYVIGADIAKLVDWTVLSVYDRTTNHQVCQMRFNKLEYPSIRSYIKHLSVKYNGALVILDSTGVGEPTYDDLSREGVPVEPITITETLKRQLIDKLSSWIELKRIFMLDLAETVKEFKDFTYDISEETKRIRYGAPVGFHDDIVISHALAVWGLNVAIMEKPKEELTPLQRDFMIKTGKLEDDTPEYEEVEDWSLAGDN